MRRDGLGGLIGDLYEAATGGLEWTTLGARLCALLDAQEASLRIQKNTGGMVNVLRPFAGDEAVYTAHFQHVDPMRAAADRLGAATVGHGLVRTGREILPDGEYLECEFYRDFARHADQRYMLIGLLGDGDGTHLSFFRRQAAPDFSEDEREVLASLIPHVRRALQLRRRFVAEEETTSARFAALERVAGFAVVVDASMHVAFANEAALAIVARPSSGLAILSAGARIGNGSSVLVARHRGENGALRQLVASAAANGPGGAMRVRGPDDHGEAVPWAAVLVSPVPASAAPYGAGWAGAGVVQGRAMVMARELTVPVLPPPSILSDLFGLSAAEAAVALALLGGRTADDVARTRQVSLDTVRSQIRTVLRKSEAASLRDLERIGAVLGSFA